MKHPPELIALLTICLVGIALALFGPRILFPPYDLNYDGKVDMQDVSIVASHVER